MKGERCHSAKCIMVKRNYPPGIHGVKGRGRLTPYGIQLREKQKAKRLYGLLEKQFAGYYQKAIKFKGTTSDVLGRFLEMRLDNVVYRLGFAASRKSARQLVNHSHFLINGKKVNIPSYQTKVGDVITVKPKSLSATPFKNMKETMTKKEIPGWLHINKENLEAKVTSLPQSDDLPKNVDMTLIIEYYSR